jgi:hypothetical protein
VSSNVLIVVTVLFVLLIAGCGIWMNAASKSVENTMDFATRVICYDSGFGAGAGREPRLPPYSDSRCVDLYSDGYDDGERDVYDPPQD